MQRNAHDRQQAERTTRSIAIIIVVLIVATGAAFWGAPHAVPGAEGNGKYAFWLGAPVAVISFIMLLRAVVELLVEPEIRMKRVLAYGVVIVSFLFMFFWLWEFLNS